MSDIPKLVRRGDVWYATWYDRAVRRTSRLSLGTKEAGEARLRFAAFLTEGGHIDRPEAKEVMTVAVVLDQYLTEHVRPKAVDVRRIGIACANLERHFGPVAVTDIDIPLCRRYAERRRAGEIGRPAQDGTIRRELGALVAAVNHAVRWRRLERGAVPHIELPAAPPSRERWLAHEELRALFAAARQGAVRDDRGYFTDRRTAQATLPRIYRFVTLAYYTAARKTSLLQLTRFQIDLAGGRIHLNPGGRRQTAKRRPVLPIDPALEPTLRATLAQIAGEYVLDHPGSIDQGFAGACRRAGIEGCTPHVLRHTRATHLLQAGVQPFAVAGLLGDSLTTVLRTYGHHCPDHLRAALTGGADDVIANNPR